MMSCPRSNAQGTADKQRREASPFITAGEKTTGIGIPGHLFLNSSFLPYRFALREGNGVIFLMSTELWLIAALALCVALSAFFSSSETAYAAASHIRLKTKAQNGEKRAALALRLAENYDELLTAILVGNNVVNIAGTAIATVLFTLWAGDMGATLSTVVMTVLILLFGEVTPKTLAKASPEAVAIAFARPLRALMVLLRPVNALFGLWRRLAARFVHPHTEDPDIEDELITMVDEAREEGGLDAHESELIHSAIEFVDQDVLAIMTPRVDVTALEDTADLAETEAAFRESGYSRIPVYHENLDHIVGVLHEKDFYAARHAGVQDIRQMMNPPVYAPATLKVSKLLRLCQSTRTHLVIVLDEFGGTEGIVTIEDVLEELVGEIYDEHDDVSEEIVALEDGSLQVDGGMQLSELMEKLHMQDVWEADTVGGWVSEVLGRIPTVGAVFETAGLRGTVTAMDRRRVRKVRLERARDEQEEAKP